MTCVHSGKSLPLYRGQGLSPQSGAGTLQCGSLPACESVKRPQQPSMSEVRGEPVQQVGLLSMPNLRRTKRNRSSRRQKRGLFCEWMMGLGSGGWVKGKQDRDTLSSCQTLKNLTTVLKTASHWGGLCLWEGPSSFAWFS